VIARAWPTSLILALGVSGLAATDPTAAPSTLALVGGRILTAPDAVPLDDGVVLIEDGRITAVGPRAKTPIPSVDRVIECKGLVVTAGFQNSHVHFTDPRWMDAATQPADRLSSQLEEMLTRYGFTTVVDTASFLDNTLAIRKRIESGEVRGPRIYTAGLALYPPNGIPYYLKDKMPADVLKLLPQPAAPQEAAELVRRQAAGGADIVKLFVGSWVARGKVLPMPQEIATAATTEAHRNGKLVFVHPSNGAGLEVALQAGVDVLAHAVDDTRDTTPEQWVRLRRQNVGLVPTLKLFDGRFVWDVLDEVREYARSGGQILFGTDVGYLTDFDPTLEYDLLGAAGLSWREILASLTTNPAQRFGEEARRGRIAPGQAADLVVLGSDPVRGPRAFADVRSAIRSGRVTFEAKPSPGSGS
jgi:imidazolonepropionase-like amidohydrolase